MSRVKKKNVEESKRKKKGGDRREVAGKDNRGKKMER